MPAPDPAHKRLLEQIVPIAQEAGALAMTHFGGRLDVTMKTGNSPVTNADLAVDTFLRARLMAAFPDYGWLSEETADTPERLHLDRLFIVDPIDGTRAFMNGEDVWCVSVAAVEHGRPVAGVLVCPARREVFTAARGHGATLNGAPMTPLAAGGEMAFAGPKPWLDKAETCLATPFRRHRFIPSLAYRIAMVADGRLTGTFVKPNAHDWDIAAADLILEECGGRLVDGQGHDIVYNRPSSSHGAMIACKPDALAPMLSVVRVMGLG